MWSGSRGILCLAALCAGAGAEAGREQDARSEYILCRSCGAAVADSAHLLDRLSPESTYAYNETLFSRDRVLVQLVTSPLTLQFQLVTASDTLCQGIGEWQWEEPWFPGYVWRPCVCPECGAHLGWIFEPAQTDSLTPSTSYPEKAFFGLVLSHLVGESFADSLLITPEANHDKSDL